MKGFKSVLHASSMSLAPQFVTVFLGEGVVEDLDDAVIWEVAVGRSKQILNQRLYAIDSGCHLENVDWNIEDVGGDIEKSSLWNEAVLMEDHVTIDGGS